MIIGGIEAGGTKFVCVVSNEKGEIIARKSLPTKRPDETLDEVRDFFASYELDALGVGSFGPIGIHKKSEQYGRFLNTPKVAWKDYDLIGRLKEDYSIPISLDTDVNVACLGEYIHGAGKDVDSCLYITVGTGIGAGFVQNGETLNGLNHPEMGHILIRQHPEDSFEGNCIYHKNCLEGLASGPAIEKRYGIKGPLLSEDKDVWELEAYYLAQAIVNYYFILSPEKVILGGGVMDQCILFPLIREKVLELVNGYLDIEQIDKLIVEPELKGDQGIIGAIEIARSKARSLKIN